MTVSKKGAQGANGILGIDFGTSNSAMAWASPQGKAQLIALEGDALAMPTAVFYNAEKAARTLGVRPSRIT